ncbi:hypothetical protein [Glycomyces albidus]|uniref:Uncharacterized protein n=1 Tax=Glycomyces albidus TaxID=2656774 RepID=A0A6L5GFQ0_9ACTN|nr:hypothetical protein [Glycomyces albidus]MQM28385.1 hypothetical protein [Glycomyces albidus]
MGNVRDLAAMIEADRAEVAGLSGPIDSSKGQAEATAGAVAQLGIEGRAAQLRQAVDRIEEAQAIRAAIEGVLVKAHWQAMSAVHGTMGPGAAKGSGPGGSFIAADGTVTTRDGRPAAGHLDAVPPHLRQDPTPTGIDLLEPPRRKKGSTLFREAVGKGDQVEDATKALDKNFDTAWDAIFGEPSPAKAQQNAVSETLSSREPVLTEMPAPKVGGGGAVMASFVASLVVTKTLQPIVRQFERISSRFRKAENRGG